MNNLICERNKWRADSFCEDNFATEEDKDSSYKTPSTPLRMKAAYKGPYYPVSPPRSFK